MGIMSDWISPEFLSFLPFLGLVAAAAAFGGQWGARDWYKSLSKPRWTPPNWLFPVAWSVLYVMIAVAGWMVWRASGENLGPALWVWVLQLLLNAGWSYVFFGRQDIGLALVTIAALWLSIAGFILLAWPVDESASLLFVPYLVWVSFAAALNLSIRLRNPTRA